MSENMLKFRKISTTVPQSSIKRRRFAQFSSQEQVHPNVHFKPGPSEKEEVIQKPRPLQEILSGISIQQILEDNNRPVVDIPENAFVYDAIRSMSEHGVGAVIVINPKTPKKEVSGIFTERDYIRKIILQKLSSKKTSLDTVMTRNIVCGYNHWNLVDCIKAMTLGKFRHLPILAGNEAEAHDLPAIAIGVVSTRDVMRYLISAIEQAKDNELVESVKLNDVFNKICRKSARTCYVNETDTVLKALEEMQIHNLGALFVYSGTELVGIFTERDYLNKVILRGRLSKDTPVKDVMTTKVISAGPMDSALGTLKLMASSGIRTIPVAPFIGKSIDYVDGKEYATIGMLNEVDFIKYAYTRLRDAQN